MVARGPRLWGDQVAGGRPIFARGGEAGKVVPQNPQQAGGQHGHAMHVGFGWLVVAGLMLAACKPLGAPVPKAPGRADLSMELIRLDAPGPPKGPEGACWARDVTPMVIETVSEQVMVMPERRDAAGKVIEPASFRTDTHQRIVQEREEVWFRAPCPQDFTVEFVATLQRALKARGFFLHPVTGMMDATTTESVRRFQVERGLDSPQLALAAARELGIVAADWGSL